MKVFNQFTEIQNPFQPFSFQHTEYIQSICFQCNFLSFHLHSQTDKPKEIRFVSLNKVIKVQLMQLVWSDFIMRRFVGEYIWYSNRQTADPSSCHLEYRKNPSVHIMSTLSAWHLTKWCFKKMEMLILWKNLWHAECVCVGFLYDFLRKLMITHFMSADSFPPRYCCWTLAIVSIDIDFGLKWFPPYTGAIERTM